MTRARSHIEAAAATEELESDELEELSELGSDPIAEHFLRHRKERDGNRLLSILDELERGGE